MEEYDWTTTPQEAMESIRLMLVDRLSEGEALTGDHSPEKASCRQCAAWWRAAIHEVCSGSDPVEAIRFLALHQPGPEHPGKDCADCEGCNIELLEAMRHAVFGVHGIDSSATWGPWHTRENSHGKSEWRTCSSCIGWKTARDAIRIELDGKLDSTAWLGSDDDYF